MTAPTARRIYGTFLVAGRARVEADTRAQITQRRRVLLGHEPEPPLSPIVAWRRAVLEAAAAGRPEPPAPPRRQRTRRAPR